MSELPDWLLLSDDQRQLAPTLAKTLQLGDPHRWTTGRGEDLVELLGRAAELGVLALGEAGGDRERNARRAEDRRRAVGGPVREDGTGDARLARDERGDADGLTNVDVAGVSLHALRHCGSDRLEVQDETGGGGLALGPRRRDEVRQPELGPFGDARGVDQRHRLADGGGRPVGGGGDDERRRHRRLGESRTGRLRRQRGGEGESPRVERGAPHRPADLRRSRCLKKRTSEILRAP